MLSLSEILEVAIGLVFVWILVSVAVMQTQEWIVAWLSIRADGLEEAIWGMLADEKNPKKTRLNPPQRAWEQFKKLVNRWFPGAKLEVPEAPEIVGKLYEHPVIKALAQEGEKASYIPADKFVAALFDVVMSAGTADSVVQRAFDQLGDNLEDLEVKLTPQQVGNFRTVLEGLLQLQDATLPNAYKQFETFHPRLAAELDKWGVNKQSGAAIRTALNQLSGRLWYLKLSPDPQDVQTARRLLKQSLAGVKDLSQVKAVCNQLRRQHPAIGPIMDALGPTLDELIGATSGDEMLAQIINGAAAMAADNPGIQRTLESMVANARAFATEKESAIALARTEVETWFDDTMARANGWYKRNRQVGAFVIALFFAALINVDTVDIGMRLWREPTLRQAVVAQAERYDLRTEAAATEEPSAVATEEPSVYVTEEPSVEPTEEPPVEPTEEPSVEPTKQPPNLKELEETVSDLENSLAALEVPIGWKFRRVEMAQDDRDRCKLFFPNPKAEDGGDVWGWWLEGDTEVEEYTGPWCIQLQEEQSAGVLSKLLGLSITAAAATLGAPFWFDILQKLIGIRSAGGKPTEPGSQGGQTQQ